MDSIYDNVGVEKSKHKTMGVRLSPWHYSKLEKICSMFDVNHQQFIKSCIDSFYASTLDVQSGYISINSATKESMNKLLDEFIKTKELQGIAPVEYSRPGQPPFQRSNL